MKRFPFYPAPDKRKREASDETDKHQNKSLNSSGVEEPLWPDNSVSSHEDSVSVDDDGAESPVGFDESSSRKETRSKERGTRVKDCAKNGTSEKGERGWGRKEGNACRQTPGF